MKKHLILFSFALFVGQMVEAKEYQAIRNTQSDVMTVTVSDQPSLQWSIERNGVQILKPSDIRITTPQGTWGEKTVIKKATTKQVKNQVSTPLYQKRSEITEEYTEMSLQCSGDFDLLIRVYDDCCAYRLVGKNKKPMRVISETSSFVFADDYQAFIPYVNDNRGGERYCYSFESYYDEQKLSEMYSDSLSITPLAVCLPNKMKAVVMETAVENYPGMFLYRNSNTPANTLLTDFAPLPLEWEVGGFDRLNLVPTKRADYIAEIQPKQQLPWRMVMVTTSDKQLIDTDTPYSLAPSCRIADTSWIKPGKVAWDWWNNWNLTGVDFRAGINTQTYKYYIDFAQKNGLEYIIVDEGWSNEEDLLQYANDELSIPELVAYGKERNVGVILWSSWRNLIKDLDRNMRHYAEVGVKGFKIDFFDRDDQIVIKSSYEMAAMAAQYHLLVDYHGLKPSGVQRAYPNVLNFEGVKGLENCKWEQRGPNGPIHDMPRYDVSIPYLRMLPGPMDYTPGAMINATRDAFFGNNNNPMGLGTRVHQMAMYVMYDAPLQMLADSPTHYEKNQECTDFIASVPTRFNQTLALCGEMGEYAGVARFIDNKIFISVLNNWTPRTITLDLSFLPSACKMRCFADGINADRDANDYKVAEQQVKPTDKLTITLAPGGGWAASLTY